MLIKNCSEFHETLKGMNYFICPICNSEIHEDENNIPQSTTLTPQCCNSMKIINDNNILVCISCGQNKEYEYVNEPIDFYRDLYRLNRKSRYQRKYHVRNVFYSTLHKNHEQFDYNEIEKFFYLFELVEAKFKEICPNRRRFIKFKFIFFKILQYMNIKHYYIFKIKLTKKVLKKYNQIWKEIIPCLKRLDIFTTPTSFINIEDNNINYFFFSGPYPNP